MRPPLKCRRCSEWRQYVAPALDDLRREVLEARKEKAALELALASEIEKGLDLKDVFRRESGSLS